MTATPTIDPSVFRRDRRKRLLRRLVAIGVVTALTLVLVEVLLRITDPFGVAYFHDLATNFYDVSLPDPRGCSRRRRVSRSHCVYILPEIACRADTSASEKKRSS